MIHSAVGSSPLARGLQTQVWNNGTLVRIIPARAGFTVTPPKPVGSGWDHPRSRGVYQPRLLEDTGRLGSSPLARGLQFGLDISCTWAGIIPARAGFTGSASDGWEAAWDHPRSRGVYLRTYATSAQTTGSSPLARGLRKRRMEDVNTFRIIPARAGFTPPPLIGVSPRPDHPRSRGVYT